MCSAIAAVEERSYLIVVCACRSQRVNLCEAYRSWPELALCNSLLLGAFAASQWSAFAREQARISGVHYCLRKDSPREHLVDPKRARYASEVTIKIFLSDQRRAEDLEGPRFRDRGRQVSDNCGLFLQKVRACAGLEAGMFLAVEELGPTSAFDKLHLSRSISLDVILRAFGPGDRTRCPQIRRAER